MVGDQGWPTPVWCAWTDARGHAGDDAGERPSIYQVGATRSCLSGSAIVAAGHGVALVQWTGPGGVNTGVVGDRAEDRPRTCPCATARSPGDLPRLIPTRSSPTSPSPRRDDFERA